MPSRRLADIVLLCLLSSLAWVVLPACVPDSPSGNPSIFTHGTTCIKDDVLPQLITGATIQSIESNSKVETGAVPGLVYQPQPCLYGVQYNPSLCAKAHKLSREEGAPGSDSAKACTTQILAGSSLADNTSYCCAFKSIPELIQGNFQVPGNCTCPLHLGDSFVNVDDHEDHTSYNPMASLTLAPFRETASNLFSRGVPYLFPMPVMFGFLVAFFFLAALTSGSAIPSGTLLPWMIIGALIGRILSLVLISIQQSINAFHDTSCEFSFWADEWCVLFKHEGGPLSDNAPLATNGWMDPGVGALVGAAAFMGGASRTTLMITVMIIEITGDPMMIAPVGVATLAATVVGNKLNHGVYHQLIDVASFSFMPDRWPKSMPKALRIEHILPESEEVVCVALEARRSELVHALGENTHSTFPVVDSDGVIAGLTTRTHIQMCLKDNSVGDDAVFDMGKVTDFNFITIRKNLPLEPAFQLHKRMDGAHMVVVDKNHRPLHVISRCSLLPWNVVEHIGHDRIAQVRPTIQRPASMRRTSGRNLQSPNSPTFEPGQLDADTSIPTATFPQTASDAV